MIGFDHCNIPIKILYRGTREWRDLRLWLLDNVGPEDYVLAGSDLNHYSLRVVWFAHERDAVLFALRWS